MKVSDLRGILQYIPRFRGRIFVISVDGQIAASGNFSNILLDLAVLRSLNIKVILVHGAGRQIEQLAEERGVEISNSDGTGVTDDQTLKISIDAATRLTNEVMNGLTSVGLRAAHANCLISHPKGIIRGEDRLHTGQVEKVDSKSLHLFLEEGIVPIISPLGFDGEGRTYRVNSDEVAVDVAEAMQAAKVIFMSPADGVASGGEIVRQLSIGEAEDLLEKHRKDIPGNLASKVEQAARACRHGVLRVHIINGNVDEALLAEVFSNEGIGTMIYSNEYQQIRRVFKKDVRNIMSLIRQSVEDEELIRRRRAEILERLEDWWALEIDRNIVGCVALHVFPDTNQAELACLYVSNNHENQGYGKRLMGYVEKLAREQGVNELIALSTRSFRYFQKHGGFEEATPDILPPERRKLYDASKRKSRVLRKSLVSTPKETRKSSP